jgi:pimeloyl-ACP methyl ester carboxylesterase
MKNINLKKGLVALTTAALVATFAVVVPSAARADEPTCSVAPLALYNVANVTTCTGVDEKGSKYEIRMPAKFNGTLFLYSHGIRKGANLPAIPVVAPKGYIVDNSPSVAPSEEVATSLLKQGFALAGAGVQVQGWNLAEQTYASLLLTSTAKAAFPKINKVVGWGNSLGALTTQALAEQYPGTFDAVGNLCLAESGLAEITMAGDFLWGLKSFFDPTIKATGYSAGTAGYMEMLGDMGKVLVVLNALATAIAVNPTAPTWPTTSGVPAAYQGIPVRSAILLLGLISGISTQSMTYDSASGPAGASETTFGLVLSPALAVLENGAEAAVLAIAANYDMELRAGGIVYDNTKTDYSTRLGDDGDTYAAALSGKTYTGVLLSILKASPRVSADPAALARFKTLYDLQGKVTVPTVTLTATADHITPPGATQYFINKYEADVSKGRAGVEGASKAGLVTSIWNKPSDSYSTFDADGKPVKPTLAPNGTTHCNFTTSQTLLVAKLLAAAAKSGKSPSASTVKAAIKKDANLFVDPNYQAPLLKYRQ